MFSGTSRSRYNHKFNCLLLFKTYKTYYRLPLYLKIDFPCFYFELISFLFFSILSLLLSSVTVLFLCPSKVGTSSLHQPLVLGELLSMLTLFIFSVFSRISFFAFPRVVYFNFIFSIYFRFPEHSFFLLLLRAALVLDYQRSSYFNSFLSLLVYGIIRFYNIFFPGIHKYQCPHCEYKSNQLGYYKARGRWSHEKNCNSFIFRLPTPIFFSSTQFYYF